MEQQNEERKPSALVRGGDEAAEVPFEDILAELRY